jgi:predicted RNA-binding Zn-ribbon protein involved in translation (DUF1610 family)
MQARERTGMKARFFCESCGAEVAHSAKSCPSCGKTFTAIRCPRCGFEGGARQFARGCPECGYLNVVPPSARGSATGPSKAQRSERARVRAFSMPRFSLSARFYRIAMLVLVVLLVVLVAVLALVVAER